MEKNIFKYKLEIEINTPSGIKSGYSIFEITEYSDYKNTVQLLRRGDAIAIKLKPNKNLFALMISQNGNNYYVENISQMLKNIDGFERRNLISQTKTPENVDLIPMFVVFDDENNPKTIHQIYPKDSPDLFGDEFYLNGIYISKTNKELNQTLSNHLKWLEKYRRNRKSVDVKNLKGDTINIGASSFYM